MNIKTPVQSLKMYIAVFLYPWFKFQAVCLVCEGLFYPRGPARIPLLISWSVNQGEKLGWTNQPPGRKIPAKHLWVMAPFLSLLPLHTFHSPLPLVALPPILSSSERLVPLISCLQYEALGTRGHIGPVGASILSNSRGGPSCLLSSLQSEDNAHLKEVH